MLNLNASFPTKSTAPTAAYPFGGAQNVTIPGDGTGTPWIADLINDIYGWKSSLLSAAALTPSGAPEQVGNSDVLTALDALFPRKGVAAGQVRTNDQLDLRYEPIGGSSGQVQPEWGFGDKIDNAVTIITGSLSQVTNLSLALSASAAINGSNIEIRAMTRQVRSGFNLSSATVIPLVAGSTTAQVEIEALSDTDIALYDNRSEFLRRYSFDGTTWNLVGSPLSIPPGLSEVRIAKVTENSVALLLSGISPVLQTYTFDGSLWSALGNSIVLTLSDQTNVLEMGDMSGGRVMISENRFSLPPNGTNPGLLYVYSFDGTDWTQVGSSVVSFLGVRHIPCRLSNSDIALVFTGNAPAQGAGFVVYRFDGSGLTLVSPINGLSTAGSPSNIIATRISGNEFIFNSSSNGEQLDLYSINFTIPVATPT